MAIDHQAELIRQGIQDYCQRKGIELTPEQQENAFNGVKFWLDDAMADAISDSVYFAQPMTKGSG